MNHNSFAIRHRVEVEASPHALYNAITTPAGLAAWWTPMVESDADPQQGSLARFRFGDGSVGPDMRVEELAPGERVVWRCVEGPWKGMRFHFDIRAHERGAVLLFSHEGWQEPSEFYMHCNCKWGYFLGVSFKRYLETGAGAPHPQDPSI